MCICVYTHTFWILSNATDAETIFVLYVEIPTVWQSFKLHFYLLFIIYIHKFSFVYLFIYFLKFLIASFFIVVIVITVLPTFEALPLLRYVIG